MITPEELTRIRTAAIGDMLGDAKALDELGPAEVVFRLCRELEYARSHVQYWKERAYEEGEENALMNSAIFDTVVKLGRYKGQMVKNVPGLLAADLVKALRERDEARAQAIRLEREADWLADKASCCVYGKDMTCGFEEICDLCVCGAPDADIFREAARKGVEEA